MFVYLSKLLAQMVLPVGLVIELLMLALLLLWWGKRRAAGGCVGLALAVLWVFSMPAVADLLLAGLERQYPAVAVADVPPQQCIVLLGGSVQPALAPRVELDMGEAVDRVRMAARLYRAGKGQQVIVSGGKLGWPWFDQTEAGVMLELLQEWGVSPGDVIPETASRNTRENALYVQGLVETLECGPLLLVTSAGHMPRAVAVFEAAGMAVVPVPTDIRVYDRPDRRLQAFMPAADSLERSQSALRERLGLLIYRLRGWA